MRFGKQRPPADLAALALLFAGFTALAVAIFYLRASFIGALLPLTFIAGAIAGLRAEVREIELQENQLVLRTMFRSYAIPRAHIRAIVMTERGVAIDVLNGARYPINPPGVDPEELRQALSEWMTG